QVLLSQGTVEALRDDLPATSELRPLGLHRLRDIAQIESVYQLVAPGLPGRFPPLNTLDVAYRRGLLRATLAASVILTVVAALAVAATREAHRADRNA